MIAVFPGTFDPITIGHIKLIERANKVVDKLYVLVLDNRDKKTWFSLDERKELVKRSIQHIEGVEVVSSPGLTVDLARKLGAQIILRGIRSTKDDSYESFIEQVNLILDQTIETLYIHSRPEYSELSSSLVKEVALCDGDLTSCVSENIINDIKEKVQSISNHKEWR